MDERSGITDNWILDHVVPNMVSHGIESQVCKVSGCAVLFCSSDRSGDDAIPPHKRMQIMKAYGDLDMMNALKVGRNPVIQRPLLVNDHDTEVMMDFLEEEGDGGGDGNLRRSLAMWNQEVRLLSSHILHMRHELMDAWAEADRQIGILKCQMMWMSNNISCLSNRPGCP